MQLGSKRNYILYNYEKDPFTAKIAGITGKGGSKLQSSYVSELFPVV